MVLLIACKVVTMVLFCDAGEEGPEDGPVEGFRLRAVRGLRVADEVFVSTSHDRRTLVRRAHSKLKGEKRPASHPVGVLLTPP